MTKFFKAIVNGKVPLLWQVKWEKTALIYILKNFIIGLFKNTTILGIYKFSCRF